MSTNINPYYTNRLSFVGNPGPDLLTRDVKAKRIVNLHAIAAGISTGAAAQVPGLDYVALTGISAHMVNKLAKIYNIPSSKELNLKLVAALATENAFSSISDLFQYLPVVGNIGNGLLSVGITKVTGNFFKSMFKAISESKGTIKPEEINISELKNLLIKLESSIKNKLTFKKSS